MNWKSLKLLDFSLLAQIFICAFYIIGTSAGADIYLCLLYYWHGWISAPAALLYKAKQTSNKHLSAERVWHIICTNVFTPASADIYLYLLSTLARMDIRASYIRARGVLRV